MPSLHSYASWQGAQKNVSPSELTGPTQIGHAQSNRFVDFGWGSRSHTLLQYHQKVITGVSEQGQVTESVVEPCKRIAERLRFSVERNQVWRR